MRWNNSQEDIANFVRKIRENEKLFDVTLVTDDGQHVKAHKVILAAGSLFFENVFMVSNQTSMLIYLKGIGSCELQQVLDFLYTGEAVIRKEEVEPFLETAKDLQIYGLDSEDSPLLPPNQEDEVKTEDSKNIDVYLAEASQKVNNADSGSTQENLQLTLNLNCENGAGFDDSSVTQIESVQKMKNEDLDAKLQQMLVKKDGLWECKICGKTSLYSSRMIEHTETHIEGLSHPCHICSKTFANRHTLRVHISGVHSELFTCDVCGKSGMNKKSYRAHQRRQHKASSDKQQ